ncbi:hypothetical protein GCM10010512_09310 [Streptomyces thermoviolaceus subsp. thermoviolaceus]|nr:hypothetical protein GCM10010499_02310 [Streptomyces thermoviolaceus subsp. apingens]GHA80235.1 hypothetical protein GCM10010512_09310 [Streptomyces thermoviolaceus subsp. thermoviolaceus]
MCGGVSGALSGRVTGDGGHPAAITPAPAARRRTLRPDGRAGGGTGDAEGTFPAAPTGLSTRHRRRPHAAPKPSTLLNYRTRHVRSPPTRRPLTPEHPLTPPQMF